MFRGFVFSGSGAKTRKKPGEVLKHLNKSGNVVWIDIEDPSEQEIDFLIEKFDFHPLSIEDSVIQQDHPKLEEFTGYVFLIMYAIQLIKGEVRKSQLNIFFGKNYVITVHDIKVKAVERVISKIKKGNQKINFHKGPDYLVHDIIDSVVDEYFPVIDRIEDKLDEFEDIVLEEREASVIDDIIEQKRNILDLRKLLSLEKPVINKLERAEVDYIKKSTRVYFRDIYDHISEMSATLENMRDIIPSLLDAFNSMTVKKTNESIHRLTIVATIAVPLTVITSFYGMNIYLPEAELGKWSYPLVWGILVIVAVVTYIILKKNFKK